MFSQHQASEAVSQLCLESRPKQSRLQLGLCAFCVQRPSVAGTPSFLFLPEPLLSCLLPAIMSSLSNSQSHFQTLKFTLSTTLSNSQTHTRQACAFHKETVTLSKSPDLRLSLFTAPVSACTDFKCSDVLLLTTIDYIQQNRP